MGTPGIPLNPSKLALVEAIKKCRGRVSHIAIELGCHIITVNKYIDQDPELVELLAEYRNKRDHSLLDGAEDVLQFAIDNKDKDINAALKSSFFVLNNKGKLRGYYPTGTQPESTDTQYTPKQILDSINTAE